MNRLAKAGVGVGALAAMAMPYGMSSVLAESPQGANPTHGDVAIYKDGQLMEIIASDGSIIDYDSFNIGSGYTVEFIQPGQHARVLNRVLSGDPTQIDGTLTANGQVYIASPGGIFFGNNAVVDVAGLVAGAGTMSDADFLQGNDLFTNMDGSVINEGTIQGKLVALIGEHVANRGTIIAPDGMITLAAGDDVYLGQRNGGIMVRLEGGDAERETAAVENEGTLDAGDEGRVSLGASDVYNLAVNHSGSARGQQVVVSGEGGQVEVSGDIDASSSDGLGGDVQVTGRQVAIEGDASIDASGGAGGGSIRIGGDYQGEGDLLTAETTFVGSGVSLNADAGESGDGGTIIVWADGATGFFGELSARGGAADGDGGFAEVSGKDYLEYRGTADLRAPGGAMGMLLLDPTNIEIGDFSGTSSNGAFSSGDWTPSGSTTSQIDIGDLTTQLQSADVTLDTGAGTDAGQNGDIDWLLGADLDFDGVGGSRGLFLVADGNVTINSSIFDGDTGTADNLTLDIQSAGDITVNDSINTAGGDQIYRAGLDGAGSTNTFATTLTTTGAIQFEGDAGADDFTVTGDTNAGTLDLRGSIESATLQGAVDLTALDTEAGGYDVDLAGGGIVTDATTFNNTGSVSFGGSSMTFDGGVNTEGTSGTTLDTDQLITSNGAIELGPVTLARSVNISADDQDVSTLTVSGGGNDLSVNSAGGASVATAGISDVDQLLFNGFDAVDVGGVLDVNTLTLNAIENTAEFSDLVTADTFTLLGGSATATFNATITLGTIDTGNVNATLEVLGGGTVGSASLEHNGGLVLAEGVTFTDGLTYTDGTLSAEGTVDTDTGGFDLADVVATGDVNFDTNGNGFSADAIDATTAGVETVEIVSGNGSVAFGNVGTSARLGQFDVTAGTGTITHNGGQILTSGDVTFGSTYELTENTTIDTDGGALDFSSTTVTASGGNHNLGISTGTTAGTGTAGDVTLAEFNDVGGSRVGDLSLDLLDDTVGEVTLSGGAIEVAGNVGVDADFVRVAGNTTVDSQGGNVDLSGVISEITGDGASQELEIYSNGGNITLGTVGGTGGDLLGLVRADVGTGELRLDGDVEAAGVVGTDAVAFAGDNLVIDADRQVEAVGDIDIQNDIYADGAGHSLSVLSDGTATLGGSVGDDGGSAALLDSLTVAGAVGVELNASVEVADAVDLTGGDVSATGITAGGDITSTGETFTATTLLESTGTDGVIELDHSGAIVASQAAADQVVVRGGDGVTFSALIEADELQFTGTGDVSVAAMEVGTLAADLDGGLNVTQQSGGPDLTIGSVDSDLAGTVAGITTTAGHDVTVDVNDNQLTVAEAIDAGGALSLTATASENLVLQESVAGDGVTLDGRTGEIQSTVDGTVDARGGQLVVNADSIDLAGTLTSAGGDLVVRPETTTRDITVGNATGGGLVVDQSTIDLFTEGFNQVTIGRADGEHAIAIEEASFNDSVLIQSPAGGSITVADGGAYGITLRNATSATGKSITLAAAGSADSNDAANEVMRIENDLLTDDGAITLDLVGGSHGLAAFGPEGETVTLSSAVDPASDAGADITLSPNLGGTGNTTTADQIETLEVQAGGGEIITSGTLNPTGAELALQLEFDADEITLPEGEYYGNPVFTADTINFPAGADSITPVSGGVAAGTPDLNITFQPRTSGLDIGVGASVAGGLVISQSDLDAMADGFNSITIGRANGSGFMTINEDASGTAMAFKDPMFFRMPDGEITVHDAGGGVASISQSETVVNADHIRNRSGSVGAAIVDPLTAGLTFHSASATTELAGRTETNGTAIEFIDAVELTGDTVLATTGITGEEGDYAGADITFGGDLDGSDSAEQDLTLTAGTGDIRFEGVVGGATALGDVVITSEGAGAAADVSAIENFRARSFTQSEGTGNTTFFADLITRGQSDPNPTALGEGGDVSILIDGVIRLLGTTDTRGGEPASADPGYAGGDILLQSPDRVVLGSVVTDGSQAGTGDGGDAGDLVVIDASEITLNGDITARGGTGDNTGAGGQIVLGSGGDTDTVTVDDDIAIRTGSTGGNLTVVSDLLEGDSNELVLRLGTGSATFATAVDDFDLIDVQNATDVTFTSPVSNVDHTEIAITSDLQYNDDFSGGSLTADVGDEALFVNGFNLTGTLLIESATDVTVPGAAVAGSIQQESGTGHTQFLDTVTTTSTGGLDLSTNQITFVEAVDVTNGGAATLVNSGQLTINPNAVFTISGGQGFSQSGGGDVDLGANITTGGGSQANIGFGSQVRLTETVTLSTNAGDTGNISLGGGVIAQTPGAGGEQLTLEAGSGNITVSDDIGDGVANPLNSLTIASANNADLLGTISLIDFTQTLGTGQTTFGDTATDVVNIDQNMQFDDVQDVTANAPVSIVNGALDVDSARDLTFNEAVDVQTGVLQIDDARDVVFGDTLDVADAAQFGSINNLSVASDLTVGAGLAIATANDITVGGATDVTDAIQIGGARDVDFVGAVQADAFVQNGGTGETRFQDTVDIANDLSLGGINGMQDIRFDGLVTIGGDATFTDVRDLRSTATPDAFDVTGDLLITDARDVLIDGTVDATSITQQDGSGGTTFDGDVTVDEGRNVGLDDVAFDVRTSGTVTLGGALTSADAGNTEGGGDIIIQAGDVDFSGVTDSITADVDGGGAYVATLRVEPRSGTGNMSIGDGSGGGVFLTGGDVDSISGDFDRIFMGRADGSGTMTIGDGPTFKSPTFFRMPLAGGGITITSGGVSGSGRASLTFDAPQVNLGGAVATAGENVNFISGGSLDTDDPTQHLGDGGAADDGLLDVVVTGTASVNTTADGETDGANIVFENRIDDSGGTHVLALNSGDLGNIDVHGPAGGNERVGDLTITNANDATFHEAVAANTFTQVDGQGTTEFTSTLDTTGDILVQDANDLVFGDTVSAASFEQQAGNDTTFNGTLTSLTTAGDSGDEGGDVEITLAGDLLVSGGIDARGGARTIPGNGRAGGTVDLVADTIDVASINTSGGTVTSGRGGDAGDIGLDAVSNDIRLRGDLTAIGSDGTSGFSDGDAKDVTIGNTYTAAVELQPDSDYIVSADTITVAGNDVAFNGTVDAATGVDASLAVNTFDDSSQSTPAGVTEFNGNVGENEALVGIVTDAAEANGSTELNASFINATDLIAFNDAVVVEAADVTLRGDSGGGHTALTQFNNTLDSAASEGNDLTIDAIATEFHDLVGESTDGALGTLTTTQDSGADLTTLNTAAVTAENVLFNDAVEIAAGTTGTTTVSGTSASGVSVLFDSTVDSTAGEQNSLLVESPGVTRFSGDIGTVGADPSDAAISTALGRLETDEPGETHLAAGTINTLGSSVEHNDAVVLFEDVTYNEFGPGDVVFNQIVDSNNDGGAGATGPFDLTVNTADGNAIFRSEVGTAKLQPNADRTHIGTLTTSSTGDGEVEIHADVIAVGVETNNPLRIGADQNDANEVGEDSFGENVDGTVVIGEAGTTNSLTFNNTVDSLAGENENLTLVADTSVTFEEAVGGEDRLANLLVEGGNTTTINGGSIESTEDQTFEDAIVLGDDTTIDSTNGTITFENTIDSDDGSATPRDLTVTAGAFAHFNGAVGGTEVLENLTAQADDGGVRVNESMTVNDTIDLTGTGAAGGDDNVGVEIAGAGTALAADTIAINGTGGDGDDGNVGVRVDEAQLTVDSALEIVGVGGGTGEFNDGIVLEDATVTGLNNATVEMTGTGSGDATDGHAPGIHIVDSDVTVADGDLTIDGTGAGTGINSGGVIIETNATVSATGAGNLAITGEGSLDGTASAGGVAIVDGVDVLTNTGDITITGQAGGASGTNHGGIGLETSTVASGDGGRIILEGHGGATGGADSEGISTIGTVAVGSPDGTVELHAVGYNGNEAVFFDTDGTITADSLALVDADVANPGGDFLLEQDNQVDTLAADTTGSISFNNAIDYTVGTVTLGDTSDVVGVTTSGLGSTVNLTGDDNLHLEEAVTTNGGNVDAAIENDLTSDPAGEIVTTADTDSGAASGDVDLDSASGNIFLEGEIVTTGAANNAGNGSIGGDVTIDALNGDIELVAITSSGGDGLNASDGGNAGAISVTASPSGYIRLHDDLTAVGGAGDTASDNDGLAGDITLTTDPTTGVVHLNAPGAEPGITLSGNDVTFASEVESLDDTNPQALVVNTFDDGTTHFQGGVGLGDDGDALTGDDRPLASLTTNADGTTVISGGDMLTTGEQHYHDDVVLTEEASFYTTGGDSEVRFFATLNSENPGDDDDATFNLDNGTLRFDGPVGGDARLGELRIVDALDVMALDAVTAQQIVQEAGTGSTTFLGHVDTSGAAGEAGGDIDITTDGWVALMEGATLDAAAGSDADGGNLVLNPDANNNGDLVNDPQIGMIPGDDGYTNGASVPGLGNRYLDIIVVDGQFSLQGDGAGVGGDAQLNPGGRNDVPWVATVAGGSDLAFNAGSFEVGEHEKLTVYGDFEVTTTDGDITVNDMTVLEDIDFEVASGSDIRFRRRDEGTVVTPALLTQDDLGVDIVLGGTFYVNEDPIALGAPDPAQPIIASPGGEHDAGGDGGPLSHFVNRDFGGPLEANLLSLPGGAIGLSNDLNVVLDLTAERATTANVSEAIAGAIPRPEQAGDVIDDTSAGQAQQEVLADLGLISRDLTSVEFLWLLAGQRVYNDLGGDVADDTRRVASSRLSFGVVEDVVTAYRGLMFEEVMDEDAGEMTLVSRRDDLRETLADAFAAFQESGESFSGEAFLTFTQDNPDHLDAANVLIDLEDLFVRIERIGLTPGENAAVRTRLYDYLLPEGMTTPQLNATLDAVAQNPDL